MATADDGMLPDKCSLSNPQHVRTRSLHLTLDVDFRKCTLVGTVEFTAEVLQNGAASFDLDTRAITIKGARVEGKSVTYSTSKVYQQHARARAQDAVGCERVQWYHDL